MRTETWNSFDRHTQYRAIVLSSALFLDPEAVFSHHSAAALWRLPCLRQWPVQAHITIDWRGGGLSNQIAVRHSWGVPASTDQIDGVNVTSLVRTVVDLARLLPFADAVVAADAALRRAAHPVAGVPHVSITRADLLDELASVRSPRGVARAREVIAFTDGRADRPGESVSRVSMHRAGLTPPELQVELRGLSGKKYTVDFWWPEFNVIGEFDGAWKYKDPEFLRGRTPEQALLDEKEREDDLRAAGHGFTRWKWKTANSPRGLATWVGGAGVR